MSTKTSISFPKGRRSFINRRAATCSLVLLLAIGLLPMLHSRVLAQVSMSKDRIITYQAQILKAGIPVPDGIYYLTASLYSDADGKTRLWTSRYAAEVRNGIANLSLGEVGVNARPLPEEGLDGPLYLGISVGSNTAEAGEEMRPLTRLSSTLNALSVADNSITKEKLNTSYVEKIVINGDTIDGRATTLDITAGTGIMMTKDGKDRIVISALGGGSGSTPNSATYWSESGNSSLSGTAYLGTSDASPLPLKVNASRVMLYDKTTNSVNVLGGSASNTITGSIEGVTIAGGGTAAQPNDAQGGYGVIAGGLGNQSGNYSVVGGGEDNDSRSDWSVVGGGQNNVTTGDEYTTIGGGVDNSITGSTSSSSTIAGGNDNEITGAQSTIGGGYDNTITGDYSAIPGGQLLTLGDNSFGFNGYTVPVSVAGSPNTAYFGDVDLWLGNKRGVASQLRFYEESTWGNNYTSFEAHSNQASDIHYYLPDVQGTANSVLTNNGSGQLSWTSGSAWILTGNTGTNSGVNYIGTTDNQAFEIHVDQTGTSYEGRGRVMRYEPKIDGPNLIGGYNANSVSSSKSGATISGGGRFGDANVVTGNFGTISGGYDNLAYERAVVGGGSGNRATAEYASVLGGIQDSAIGSYSVVGGGSDVAAHGQISVAVGGNHSKAYGLASFVGGGDYNRAHQEYSTVVGGHHNSASGRLAFVGGGGRFEHPLGDQWKDSSNVAIGNYSVVVGGSYNRAEGYYSFIGGGGADADNTLYVGNKATQVWASVLGGASNEANGRYSSILGGTNNVTSEDYAATVAGKGLTSNSFGQVTLGYYNKVYAGYNIFPLRNSNRLLIIGNGWDDAEGKRSNAFEVSANGHSIVYDTLSKPDVGSAINAPNAACILGATYVDNVIYAWGDVPTTGGTATSCFGINPVILFTPPNKYTITLNTVDPDGGAVNLNQGSVTATIRHEFNEDPGCRTISASSIVGGQFTVYTHAIANGVCGEQASAFHFKVTGRSQ